MPHARVCRAPLHDQCLDWDDALPEDELEQARRHAVKADLALFDLFVRHRLTTFAEIRAVAETADSFTDAVSQLSRVKLAGLFCCFAYTSGVWAAT